ncbi:MAG TPA: NUDIX domain-containing protein, partial [Anaerolineales bacterium]|nr:NUDIX domain-containing protein [Anaerolineales bacterium]
YGERIGRQAVLRLGCSATIFDPTGTKVLLTQRSDNQLWCLPGGGVDPGESVAETCVREVWEETGLEVQIERLLGVYSDPDVIVEYRDGNRFQLVALNFAVRITGGAPGLSVETSAVDYFTAEAIENLPLLANQRQRIADAFAFQEAAFVR